MINTDTNHYLKLIDPRIVPNVGHCKVAFMGDHFLWASFQVAVTKNGLRLNVGELVYYAPDKIEARLNKYDNGVHYIYRGTQAEMVDAIGREG